MLLTQHYRLHIRQSLHFRRYIILFVAQLEPTTHPDPTLYSASLISERPVYTPVYLKFTLGHTMKTEIGSYEAKTKLPELLRQVKTGKSFTITNREEAIADLVPSAGARTKDKVAAAEKLKAFMLADPVRGVNIKELIEEGRA
jgi:antitoxin (DNA-binding transcriptional repressor) of toxin-antitoxin stability system